MEAFDIFSDKIWFFGHFFAIGITVHGGREGGPVCWNGCFISILEALTVKNITNETRYIVELKFEVIIRVVIKGGFGSIRDKSWGWKWYFEEIFHPARPLLESCLFNYFWKIIELFFCKDFLILLMLTSCLISLI